MLKCEIVLVFVLTEFSLFFFSTTSVMWEVPPKREIRFTLKWKQLNAFKLRYFVTNTLFCMGASPGDTGEVPVR